MPTVRLHGGKSIVTSGTEVDDTVTFGVKQGDGSYVDFSISIRNLLGQNVESLKDLTLAANKGLYATGANTLALFDLTSAGRALLDDADAAEQRATLGVSSTAEIAAAYQPLDSDLTAIAALSTTSFGRAFLALADAAAARTAIDAAQTSHTHAASAITSGTFDAARFLESTRVYEFDPLMPNGGGISAHLSMPSLGQAAIEPGYIENKLQFQIPTSVEYSTNSGSSWTAASFTATELAQFFSGRPLASLVFPTTWTNVRFTWEQPHANWENGYVFLNAIYLYGSTKTSNTLAIKIERRDFTTGVWSDFATSSAVNTYPGHIWFPHANLSFDDSAGKADRVRVTFNLVFGSGLSMDFKGMSWYGVYPAAERNKVWTYDENRAFVVVEKLKLEGALSPDVLTVATLPASPSTNDMWAVSDDATYGYCWVIWNGSAWKVFSSGGVTAS